MTDNRNDSVTFAAFESACTRLERANRRLWVVVLVLLAVLLATNAAWIYYESQWQVVESTETTTTQTVTQDGENNKFIGGDAYGETAGKHNNDNTGNKNES